MATMAYSSRDLARAASIYDMMLRDTECGVILCLAGSLISAGMQKIIVDLMRNHMVDAIVSTGARTSLTRTFSKRSATSTTLQAKSTSTARGDAELREMMIDRIYDTFIDEEELRICDETTEKDHQQHDARCLFSSREYIREMGKYLQANGRTPKNGNPDSIVLAAYELDIPIFVPGLLGLLVRLRHRGPPACTQGQDGLLYRQLARTFTN